MHKVIVRFIDLKDDNHLYDVGDIFPREETKVTKARLKELGTKKNRRKKALIELISEQDDEENESDDISKILEDTSENEIVTEEGDSGKEAE